MAKYVDSLLTKSISSLCQIPILGVNFPVQPEPVPSCIPMHKEIPVNGNIARSQLVLQKLMKAENQYTKPNLFLVGTPIWYVLLFHQVPLVCCLATTWLAETRKWHHIVVYIYVSGQWPTQCHSPIRQWAVSLGYHMLLTVTRSVRELQTNNMGSKITLYRIANFHGMYLKFRQTNSAEFATWYG